MTAMVLSVRTHEMHVADLAAASRAALDAPIEGDAELWMARPKGDAIALGAFQRADAIDPGAAIVRRGSGGPAVRLDEGSLWIALLLPRVDALVACDEVRIVNRHVRPILRALTKRGHPAAYFGRDTIHVKRAPVGWIGFAHDAGTGRTCVEAIVACRSALNVDPASIEDAVIEAWAKGSGRAAVDRGPIAPFARGDEDARADPPWAAVVGEAIGPIGAGPDARGRFRVGGDLLVSRDAIARLEDALPSTADDDVPALVDATLRAPGVAIEGVRSLTSVAGVVLSARAHLRARK